MPEETELARERDDLMAEIAAEVRDTAEWTGRKALSVRVRNAMATVPRHAFVPAAERHLSYRNHPLPIGLGQTISQPYIVAIMTELLDIGPDARVLEVGTGSGYQTAVLAEVAAEVWSVELLPELADTAREKLGELGYANVHIRTGNGREGWPEAAPFDAIMVTAAAESIPETLVRQLKPGGRMIIPVDDTAFRQRLVLVIKDEKGDVRVSKGLPVAFVPLRGRFA
ncbi:MAG: protein-L-isoaspartate(D-aspartate) O-methyltransferase [Rhodospirillales bacterium]|nr:protein-L-isoaspartate(D-aspartate) O-methyltransferase [Rhodospirillales bacterium]MCW8861237.1 protein-L-isoaspartate(D-aspartate) O-methyltransferase [Rhodospirillales bacterium]MCW8953052.1 protein-L-isoaspartate(D-aspartate) O-methyltransferase [Rhodospirillales bacterium]MCW8969659.1 protein-L-isoaspartate(D-aspartate) O-methyltransferase [Rhodospirillales bacterium]MCW9001515.1 protein-L-isoaspartate(D-aspartate) O-methyltransferase [Rhodospirillales bacterium]